MAQIQIKDFIFQLLKNAECRNIRESGDNFSCQCPYHRPKHNTSSFGISFKQENAGQFHCFSCHEEGNIYSLVMFLYKCSFKEAKRIIKKNVLVPGINIDCIRNQLADIRRTNHIDEEKVEDKVVLPPKAFNQSPMYEYLEDRNKYKQHEIMNLEFIINRYELYYCDVDRFKRRIIIPLRSPSGECVYFTNRAIDSWAKKNLFVKGSHAMNYVYGLYESIGKKKVILTEGPFDLWQLKSFALKNQIKDFGFIASLGTEVQEERAAIIAEFFEEVWVCFDSDEAGLESEKKAVKVLSDFVKVRGITDRVYKCKDPAICNRKQLWNIFGCKTLVAT